MSDDWQVRKGPRTKNKINGKKKLHCIPLHCETILCNTSTHYNYAVHIFSQARLAGPIFCSYASPPVVFASRKVRLSAQLHVCLRHRLRLPRFILLIRISHLIAYVSWVLRSCDRTSTAMATACLVSSSNCNQDQWICENFGTLWSWKSWDAVVLHLNCISLHYHCASGSSAWMSVRYAIQMPIWYCGLDNAIAATSELGAAFYLRESFIYGVCSKVCGASSSKVTNAQICDRIFQCECDGFHLQWTDFIAYNVHNSEHNKDRKSVV